jgi:hypothetical protein
MSVKQLAHDIWTSTLTGHQYDSLAAAQHYDSLEKRRASAQTPGQAILERLSAEEIKSLAMAFNSQIDENLSRPDGDKSADEFFANHTEGAWETEKGARNAAALGTWLRLQGKRPPFSSADLELAYDAVNEVGGLALTGPAKTSFNEAEAYEMPLEELKARGMGWK